MKLSFKILLFSVIFTTATNAKPPSSESTDDHKPSKQAAKGGITAYDQRQTGKFNIHLNIKDVQLISLKGDRFGAGVGDETVYDYGDYDYNPGDFTVNPLIALLGINNSTTDKPPHAVQNTMSGHHNVTETNHKPASLVKGSGVAVSHNSPHHKVVASSAILKALTNSNKSPESTESNKPQPPIRIFVKPGLRKLMKRKKTKPVKKLYKPPFRLRAVYRRPPQRVQVLPRKVATEFVIEAPSNDRGDEELDEEDFEELESEVDPHEIEIDDEDDDDEYEGSPDGNTNKKKKKKGKKPKRKKNKKRVPYPYPYPPYPYEYYEHEHEFDYEPEPLIHYYRPPPVYEYEFLEDDDDAGLKPL